MGNRILRLDNLEKTANYLKKNGLPGTFYAAIERVRELGRENYRYRLPDQEELLGQRQRSVDWPWLFSIITPAYETQEAHLREMIASVQAQSYRNWELVIVDSSAGDEVERIVEQVMQETGERRIRYSRLTKNRGIAENTNAGIALAKGDYIAFLDHDDFITPDALYYMADTVRRCREGNFSPALIYSNEDKFDEASQTYVFPHKKKMFNLDLILSNNYICHFMAVEAGLMKRLKLRREFDGAQDYDLVLRVVDSLWPEGAACPDAERICHVPRVLYHWRSHRDSTAANTGSKTYAYEAGRRALEDFCARRGIRAQVEHSLHLGFYRINYMPDILKARKDVGVVGGKILDAGGRIFAGPYDEDGGCLFEGLPGHFTGGSTHRAALVQDCEAVDIRCMRLRKEFWPVFREITGLPYRERILLVKRGGEKREVRVADVRGLTCDDAGYRKMSMALGRAVAGAGYLAVWDPEVTIRLWTWKGKGELCRRKRGQKRG